MPMTPDEYNARELAAGRITASHITALTRFYQASHPGMTVDGQLGPQTRNAALVEDLAIQRPAAPVHGDVGAAAAIAWARDEHMEWQKKAIVNGVKSQAMQIASYFADEPRRTNWCAAFVASALEAGGVPVPRKGAPRRGAQALTRWVARVGGGGYWAVRPGTKIGERVDGKPIKLHKGRYGGWENFDLEPGDVICWRRPPLGWRGHVSLILDVWGDGSIKIAEGNVDGGQLVIRTLGPDEWPKRLSGLYGVARPNYRVNQ